MDIVEFPTTVDFVKAAASWITGVILQAQKDPDKKVIVGLSGGSTPGPVYTLLSTEASIRWEQVCFFLEDERYVPPEDPRSNLSMIRQTLLTHHAGICTCLFPNTALPLPECVSLYNERLQGIQPDLVILGMGEDAHVASLFPPLSPAAFGPARVIHTTTDTFEVSDRISVTLPVLLHASHRLFLINGEKKKKLLQEMQSANEDVSVYPAQYLFDERTTWMVGP